MVAVYGLCICTLCRFYSYYMFIVCHVFAYVGPSGWWSRCPTPPNRDSKQHSRRGLAGDPSLTDTHPVSTSKHPNALSRQSETIRFRTDRITNLIYTKKKKKKKGRGEDRKDNKVSSFIVITTYDIPKTAEVPGHRRSS